ncbi:Vms1/Ankzf1 family peptidyl-tRNA hydrolase [Methanosarcina hadiensis]|uniref:Vms1/Ankzf1 family peptidyl-tRNA hydrolase n=1 Tax=Methanosarcina hadiensis TaxID=3078083 RepID=UPI003977524F
MTDKNAAKTEFKADEKKGLGTIIGKISGKGKLEAEIDRLSLKVAELEFALQGAKNQLEKKEVLARQAVSDRQEAEARLNQELIRTQTLSHELESIRNESQEKLEFRGIENLSPAAAQAYLSKINSFCSSSEDLLTVYLPSGTRLSDVLPEKTLGFVEEETRSLLDRLDTETGIVFFYDLHRMVSEAIIPPFPVTSSAWHLRNNFETASLEENLNSPCRLLVLVLHAGESFIGFAPDARVFDQEEFVRSSVKEKHSKGGFSQRRFERLREEDIAHHMNKVFETLDKVLEENSPIDCIIMNGDTPLIREAEKRLPLNIEIIEKPADIKVERMGREEILRTVLSSRRYLL